MKKLISLVTVVLATSLFSSMPVCASEKPIVNNITINNTLINNNVENKEFKLNKIVVNTVEELNSALENASNGDTIVVNKDMDLSESLLINESVKLDLNGHTIQFHGNKFVLVGSILSRIVTETRYQPGYYITETVNKEVWVPSHFETKIVDDQVWEPGHYKTETVNEKVWVPGHYETMNNQRRNGHYETRNGQCVWVTEEPVCCCGQNQKWVEGYYKTETKEKQTWVEGCYKTNKKEQQVWVEGQYKIKPIEQKRWIKGRNVTEERTVYEGKDITVHIENGTIRGCNGLDEVSAIWPKNGKNGRPALVMQSGTLTLKNMILYGGNGEDGKNGSKSVGKDGGNGGNGGNGANAVQLKGGKKFVAENCTFYGGHGGLKGKKDTGWTSIFYSNGSDGSSASGLWYDESEIKDVQLINSYSKKGSR